MKLTSIVILVFIITIIFISCQSNEDEIFDDRPLISIVGASFADPSNGWFELACSQLDCISLNRAEPGSSIAGTANRMAQNSLWTESEFDKIDIFLIMHVHNKDVFNSINLKDNYKDYKLPFEYNDYAQSYDYVIKKYKDDCYNQKFKIKSKWFGSKNGKPCHIVICTHWHDGRVLFNTTVRKLCLKWNIPLIRFDDLIGFTRSKLDPITNKQASINYCVTNDYQTIDGVIYGFHPKKGRQEYIQQKLASIFVEQLQEQIDFSFK